MKIYIAALYSEREKSAKAMAEALRAAGHEVTAQWIDGGELGKSLRDAAVMDIEDVRRADALVLLTLKQGSLYKGGGRNVEFGYALAMAHFMNMAMRRVDVVGDYENVFCHLPSIRVWETTEDYIRSLA